jgi:Protein of unknown function (DUF1266)
MFKFFKELLDSVKEGVAEGKAEAKQEAEDQSKAKLEQQAFDMSLLNATSSTERFAVALAAPYRQVFSSEMRQAKEESRKAYRFLYINLLGETSKEWRNLLERDFSVTDEQTAARVILDFQNNIESDPTNNDKVAVWIVRGCYLIVTSAALEYFPHSHAYDLIQPFANAASKRFSSWEDFGTSFLRGEKTEPGSNFLGRKVLSDAVTDLLNNELSPWKELEWVKSSA